MAEKTYSQDTWGKIDKQKDSLSGLHNRMDATRDLAYMALYKLKNFAGEEMDHVINITGNKPGVFGHNIVADLINIKWQCMIESISNSITGNQARKIEEFVNDNWGQADEYIMQRYGITGLADWLCNHVCIRGPIGCQWMSLIDPETKTYDLHCKPVDMRHTPFQRGGKGWKWVAPITFCTMEEIEAEYPDGLEGRTAEKIPQGKDLEVRDFWDEDKNELWVANKKIFEQPNPYGKPPFVIVFPPAGFMLRDKGYMEHEGEDIFYLIRGLTAEVNRTLTIEQSLIFNILRPPYERELEHPTAEPNKPVPKSGQTLDVAKGERHQPVPTGDFNRANISAKNDILKMIDEGAPIAPRMYNQPPSGAELIAEMEALARLQNSRISALKVFRQQLARLMVDQCITLGVDVEQLKIGGRGRKRSYTITQLQDPDTYTVEYKSMTRDKRQEIANLTMYINAYGRVPLRYNLATILQAENPDEVMREMAMEEAIKSDPALGCYVRAKSIIEEAQDIEDDNEHNFMINQARMQAERGIAIIEQRMNTAEPLPEGAVIPQAQDRGGGNTSGLSPLISGAGGGGQQAALPKGPDLPGIA